MYTVSSPGGQRSTLSASNSLLWERNTLGPLSGFHCVDLESSAYWEPREHQPPPTVAATVEVSCKGAGEWGSQRLRPACQLGVHCPLVQ